MDNGSPGTAVQVVSVSEDHVFTLNEEALKKILTHEKVKDVPVVVVSVAGAFRKGKSFLLSFFLRFLQAKGASGWLGEDASPLEGFHWRGGSEADTSGILVWSEVFLVEGPQQQQVAVLLMDTQGAFDCESTVHESATIFALSTLISSVQVYNISQNIQENDLQHLQMFTEYGTLALEKTDVAPFQKLQFLVRDWMAPDDHAYGSDGGQKLLKQRLRMTKDQHPELRSVRKHIWSCFPEIECFLMPYPGPIVAEDSQFDGRLNGLRDEFRSCLEDFVTRTLSGKNLVVKEVLGETVRTGDLLHYFRTYLRVFQSGNLPQVTTLVQATAEAHSRSAMANSLQLYRSSVQQAFEGRKMFFEEDALKQMHLELKDVAVDVYQKAPNFGGDDYSSPFLGQLEQELEAIFKSEVMHRNDLKEIQIESDTKAIASTATESYRAAMKDLFKERPFLAAEELQSSHARIKDSVVKIFRNESGLDDADYLEPFCSKIEEDLEVRFAEIVRQNEQSRQMVVNTIKEYFARSKNAYRSGMQELLSDSTNLPTDAQLSEAHLKFKSLAVGSFKELTNGGQSEFSDPLRNALEQDLENMHAEFAEQLNKLKATMKARLHATLKGEVEFYRSQMLQFSEGSSFHEENHLIEKHSGTKNEILSRFRELSNAEGYADALAMEIDALFGDFVTSNQRAKETAVGVRGSTLNSAKEWHETKMVEIVGHSRALIDDAELTSHHETLKVEASQRFELDAVHRNPRFRQEYFTLLDQALEESFEQAVAENKKLHSLANERNANAAAHAKEFYRTASLELKEGELKEAHQERKQQSVDKFKQLMTKTERSESLIHQLEQDLEAVFIGLIAQSLKEEAASAEVHNWAATDAALKLYNAHMGRLLNDGGLEPATLQVEHEAALSASMDHFKGQPGIGTETSWRPFVTRLTQELERAFEGYAARNRDARKAAENGATAAVGSALVLYRKCFNGPDPKAEHEEAKERALQLFRERTEHVNGEFARRLQTRLEAEMESLYRKFNEGETRRREVESEELCQAAVASAAQSYRSLMQQLQLAGPPSAENLSLQHATIKNQVLADLRKRLTSVADSRRYCTLLEAEVAKVLEGFELDRKKHQLDEEEAARRAQLREEQSKGSNLDAVVDTVASLASAFSSTVGHLQAMRLAAQVFRQGTPAATSQPAPLHNGQNGRGNK